MSYISLARHYRPQTFSDLVGQELTSASLSHAIQLGREPHAVIFSGVRGVGKTTVARIYAKALNCLSRSTNGEPCRTCASCTAMEKGNHPDFVEIDGASNTSVDHVRSLLESIHFIPQLGKFKIYLIDEVHMLSVAAFNALLKTLEEPPKHVVFLFATTELHKIPETIQSRCQVFLLAKITQIDIQKRLQHVVTKENISFDESALKLVARQARGSMRDALTCLDQIIAFGDGTVTLAPTTKIFPASHLSQALYFAQSLLERNPEKFLGLCDQFDASGGEFSDLLDQMVVSVRHAMIARSLRWNQQTPALKELQLSDGEEAFLLQMSQNAGDFDLNRIFRTLVKCRLDLDGSFLDRYIFENYGIEWCLDPGLPGWAKEDLQQASAAPVRPTFAVSAPLIQTDKVEVNVQVAVEDKPTEAAAPAAPTEDEKGFPPTWEKMIGRWRQLKPFQARKLEELVPAEYSPQRIRLQARDKGFAAQHLTTPVETQKIKSALKELFQFDGELTIEKIEKETAETGVTLSQESILEKRERLIDEEKKRREQRLREHPATQTVMKELGVRVQEIHVHDIPPPEL